MTLYGLQHTELFQSGGQTLSIPKSSCVVLLLVWENAIYKSYKSLKLSIYKLETRWYDCLGAEVIVLSRVQVPFASGTKHITEGLIVVSSVVQTRSVHQVASSGSYKPPSSSHQCESVTNTCAVTTEEKCINCSCVSPLIYSFVYSFTYLLLLLPTKMSEKLRFHLVCVSWNLMLSFTKVRRPLTQKNKVLKLLHKQRITDQIEGPVQIF